VSSSVVYQIPEAGGIVRALSRGWQVSGILSARSYYTGNSGTDDMALSRSVRFGADRQIHLRAEMFNVLNTVTPGNPQTILGSSDFGRVTSLAGGTAPRVSQLGAKISVRVGSAPCPQHDIPFKVFSSRPLYRTSISNMPLETDLPVVPLSRSLKPS